MRVAYPATCSLKALYSNNYRNITGLKKTTGRRQPFGYLQEWPRIEIQQVARAGLEPGTNGLWVRFFGSLTTVRASSQLHEPEWNL